MYSLPNCKTSLDGICRYYNNNIIIIIDIMGIRVSTIRRRLVVMIGIIIN